MDKVTEIPLSAVTPEITARLASPAALAEATLETLFSHGDDTAKGSNTTKTVANKTASDAEHGAATKLQSFWRMRTASTAYREKIRSVHKMTFVFSLLVRLAVIAYLSIILFLVMRSMDADLGNNPANADELERVVLRELFSENSSGTLSIICCR